MSLQNKLANELYLALGNARTDGWVNGGDLERYAMDWGYKASNASRRLREMAEAKWIERRQVGGSVEYRYINKELPQPPSI